MRGLLEWEPEDLRHLPGRTSSHLDIFKNADQLANKILNSNYPRYCMGLPKSLPYLVNAFNVAERLASHHAVEVREMLAANLRDFEGRELIARRLRKDPAVSVRAALVLSLPWLLHDRVLSLSLVLTDVEQGRCFLAALLTRLPGVDVDELAESLSLDRRASVRAALARNLKGLKHQQRLVQRLFDDPVAEVRYALAESLGHLVDGDIWAEKMLQSEDKNLHLAVARNLAGLKGFVSFAEQLRPVFPAAVEQSALDHEIFDKPLWHRFAPLLNLAHTVGMCRSELLSISSETQLARLFVGGSHPAEIKFLEAWQTYDFQALLTVLKAMFTCRRKQKLQRQQYLEQLHRLAHPVLNGDAHFQKDTGLETKQTLFDNLMCFTPVELQHIKAVLGRCFELHGGTRNGKYGRQIYDLIAVASLTEEGRKELKAMMSHGEIHTWYAYAQSALVGFVLDTNVDNASACDDLKLPDYYPLQLLVTVGEHQVHIQLLHSYKEMLRVQRLLKNCFLSKSYFHQSSYKKSLYVLISVKRQGDREAGNKSRVPDYFFVRATYPLHPEEVEGTRILGGCPVPDIYVSPYADLLSQAWVTYIDATKAKYENLYGRPASDLTLTEARSWSFLKLVFFQTEWHRMPVRTANANPQTSQYEDDLPF